MDVLYNLINVMWFWAEIYNIVYKLSIYQMGKILHISHAAISKTVEEDYAIYTYNRRLIRRINV